MEMICELPAGYRMVFNLYVMENYSHKEIAELLNCSENTSKSQLFKARSFLKKRLFENQNKVNYAGRFTPSPVIRRTLSPIGEKFPAL